MFVTTEKPAPAKSALAALVLLLRFHGVGADSEQIRPRFGDDFGVPEMIRCAKEFGLKARVYQSRWERLTKTPLPGIAVLRDGRYLILGKASEDQVLVQNPLSPRPMLMARAEFEAVWDGRLMLLAGRAGLVELSRHFGISWFLGAIHKYRYLLGEVFVASFFLQVFALVSPLFFQVVIDKVLVNHTVSTLDVLVIGLVTISVFETVLGILRTYLFSHTTNCIDVELGARLFRHLLALPISYFQARRVGDSVARVRELENIRNFFDQLGSDAGDRFVLYVCILGGDVHLFTTAHGHRAWRCAILRRHLVGCDAAFPAKTGREVRTRRREPGVSGRERNRCRDAQGHGGRAANAAPLGGATRGLREFQLPGHQPRQHDKSDRSIDQQARYCWGALFWRQAGDRWFFDGR